VDFIFFAVLAIYDYARQSNLSASMAPNRPLHTPPILFINTVLLLLSVATMEVARRNIFREIDVLEEWLGLGRPALRRALPWLGASFALGALFLAGQWIAWKQLIADGLSYSNAAASAGCRFYLLIGVHAAHLALGLGALLFCLLALGKLKRVELRQIAVDCAAWSWFFFSGTWVVLLAILATN
jgi:cytochrome c oxidase subunit 3